VWTRQKSAKMGCPRSVRHPERPCGLLWPLKNMVVQGAAASLQHFIANPMELPPSMFHVHRHHNLLSSPMHAHSDISCCLPGFWMTAAFSSTPSKHGPRSSPKQKWMNNPLPFQVSRDHPSPWHPRVKIRFGVAL
jgi:hypothetical protein